MGRDLAPRGALLDSSFLIAAHNRGDVHHPVAAETMRRLREGEWGRALLLEYVFLEVVTVLLARRNLKVACTVGDTLLESREIEFVPCSEIFTAAVETFRGQGRRGLSFTDAAIVAVARRRNVDAVLSFDRGFRGLAGLKVVPG